MRKQIVFDVNSILDFVFYFEDHIILLIWVCLSLVLALALLLISLVFVPQFREEEKISSYECGFQPFEDTRQKFDIKYYLVAILFIVFDLEIMFMLPWVKAWAYVGIFGLIVLFVFLLVLTIGFIYEVHKKVLTWN
jgi:NADH-quinone oxidoreductase subunit A